MYFDEHGGGESAVAFSRVYLRQESTPCHRVDRSDLGEDRGTSSSDRVCTPAVLEMPFLWDPNGATAIRSV